MKVVWYTMVLWTLSAAPDAQLVSTTTAARADLTHVARDYAHTRQWQSATTANFVVHSLGDRRRAERVAAQCEALRAELCQKWLGEEQEEAWTPACHVVVHNHRASYIQCAGQGSIASGGSTYLKTAGGRISARRIDLLALDPGLSPTALPHELTHVVLADRFTQRPAPRWADEGMATLADTPQKQDLHRRDLHDALHGGRMLRISALLSMEEYPRGEQIAAFYGQSTSLVRFLVDRYGHRTFLRFLEQSREIGYDRALRENYRIDNVAHLERLWSGHLVQNQ